MLRDPRLKPVSLHALQQLANALTDANFRIYAEGGELHLMNKSGHWRGVDVFELFDQATGSESDHGRQIDAGHAFYLGYEMARAEMALHLGKQYTQDEPMNWGLLGPLKASSSTAHHHDRKE
jgi:hypothetical protein